VTKASDNEFPSLLIKEGTAPSSPAAGDQRVYIDSTSHRLSRKNSSGTVTDLESPLGTPLIGCRAYDNAGALTLTTGVITPITLNSEAFDTDGFHSTSSNTSRMTIPSGKDGYYFISGECAFAPNAAGQRLLIIYLNSVATGTRLVQVNDANPSGTNNSVLLVAGVYHLVATDYIELCAYQNSGGNLNTVEFSVLDPHLSLVLLGT
jgi:hypothetical protein